MSGLSQPVPPGAEPLRRDSAGLRGWLRDVQHLADVGFVALVIIALVYLVHEGHGNMFFYDEWGWIESKRNGLSAILDSYNQHEEIIPLAVYQLLFHTVGIDHYRWYRLLATVGHLLLVTAFYCFGRRRIGPLALLVVTPLAFFGAGWEFILWGVNFGFTTSIAVAVFALVWLDSDERSSAVGCGLLVLSLLFTETALLFSIGLAFELTWRDRGLRRFWVWALPIVLYIAWYIGFYQSYLSSYDIGLLPKFGAKLAANAAGGFFGVSQNIGWIVLALAVVLILFRVARRGAWTPRFLAVVLTLLGYWTLVAVGRATLGDPNASRYVYSGGVLLVLVILETVRGLKVDWRSGIICLVIAALATVGGLRAFPGGEAQLFDGSTSEAAQLTALMLTRSTFPPDQSLDPHWSPQITPATYFPATADLHSTGAFTLKQLLQQGEVQRSAADLTLTRSGELAVSTVAQAPVPGPAIPDVEGHLVGQLSTGAGCVHFQPSGLDSTLDLGLPASGLAITLTPDATSAGKPPSDIYVRRFASGYENAPVVSTQSGETVMIKAAADAAPQPWHVRVSPWESVTACTVGSS